MKLSNPTGRSTEEWRSDNPDQKVPDRVKLRVFERHGGICHISGRKIQFGEAWELEHVKALSLGGEHRESNFAPALKSEHKKKTAEDRKAKAKSDRIRKKFFGITKSKRKIPSRGFDFAPSNTRQLYGDMSE